MTSHRSTRAWFAAAVAAASIAEVCALAETAPDDLAVEDMHEAEGLEVVSGLTVNEALRADPRLSAIERIVLAALSERAGSSRTSVMVASEVCARIWRSTLPSDLSEAEIVIAALVRRGCIARLSGGGFVLRWRVS